MNIKKLQDIESRVIDIVCRLKRLSADDANSEVHPADIRRSIYIAADLLRAVQVDLEGVRTSKSAPPSD
jgi:hypothetical protein